MKRIVGRKTIDNIRHKEDVIRYVETQYIQKSDVKFIIDSWYDNIDLPAEWIIDELEHLMANKKRV